MSEAQKPISSPPPDTLYTFTCIQHYYSHMEGGRGGQLNQREG
jgi:hypothetical protein